MTKLDKTYILLAATICLLASCSADKETTTPTDEVELHFTAATVSDAVLTRTDASDTYNDALTPGSNIGVYIYGYEGSTGYDISQYQPNPGTSSTTWVYQTVGEAVRVDATTKQSNLILTSHTTAPKFPGKVAGSGSGDMDNVQIFAIFPNNTTVTPSTTSYQHEIDLDQTDENKIKAADLMTNDIVTYTKEQCVGQSLQLSLKHRMAKIHVTFVPKSGSDLTAANMPTAFDVLGVKRKVTITPKAGTVVLDNTAAATTEASPMQALASQSFFIPPQELAANTTFLKFDIKGNADGKFKGISGCTFKLPSATTFAAGTRYEVTVTVDVDFVSVTSTIAPWSEETMPYDPVVL